MARTRRILALSTCLTIAFAASALPAEVDPQPAGGASRAFDRALVREFDRAQAQDAAELLQEGKRIFRYDTFGSEDFWGGQLRLHQSIEGASPMAALELGLKVDIDALPQRLVAQINRGMINLNEPGSTLLLLQANAVVGVTGFFADGALTSVGIQCALCHSTVDDSFAPGIGRRLDGWPNRDLDIGKIVASAPDLSAFVNLLQVDEGTVIKVLTSWGPGKFDAQLTLDGIGFRPDGKTAATLNPAAFGLAGVNNHTWTGAWGSIPYWNAFVANLEMHGKGTFYDPRLDDAVKYPVAARARLGHTTIDPEDDLITSKLPALHFYQLSLQTPKAPAGTFNAAAAANGKFIFEGKALCANCHVPPIFTEPGWNLHTGAEIGIDDFQANRSPDNRYRTAPLRALWSMDKVHKGGFYHDGRFADLMAVVNHYNQHFSLGLTEQEKAELIEYLESI